MTSVKKLAAAIDKVAARCPRGLAAIVGEADPPTREELFAAATWRPAADRICTAGGSAKADERIVNEIVAVDALTGPINEVGWLAVSRAGAEIKRLFPRDFEAFRLHVLYIGGGRQWKIGDQSMAQALAERLRIDARTLRRRRRQIPLLIARVALAGGMLPVKKNPPP